MKIAIVHYHTRPGGVTTVIRNAQRALARRHTVEVIADFGYDETPATSRAAFERDAGRLAATLRDRLRGFDLVHTHNIALGKHPRLTSALSLFARSRLETAPPRILNQVHDFPEAGRPPQLRALRYCTGRRDDDFWHQMAYGDAPGMRWATLTTHDARQLAQRGVSADQIHVLPNPVDDIGFTRPAGNLDKLRSQLADYARVHGYRYEPRYRLLLAPMKVMVRKNNAEAVELIRRLPGWQLLISLDAASATDRAYSDKLKRQIRREHLPVIIGFGQTIDSPVPLFHLADAILTTSKVEGFGYAFIEGWLTGKPVIGRDIPAVTADFVQAGMELSHLYRKFDGQAVAGVRRFLQRLPAGLVARNRDVVLENYSLAAYARRYAAILRAFKTRRADRTPPPR